MLYGELTYVFCILFSDAVFKPALLPYKSLKQALGLYELMAENQPVFIRVIPSLNYLNVSYLGVVAPAVYSLQDLLNKGGVG